MSGREHIPSRYRAIIRESKSGRGRPVGELAEEARSLPDPYYSALALFELSGDGRADAALSRRFIQDAVRLSDREARAWRRAELLTTVCRKAKGHPPENHALISDLVMDRLLAFPPGKGLSDAVAGCVGFLGCEKMPELLRLAAGNSGFEPETSRPVIRHWVKVCSASPEDISGVLGAMPDGLSKVKLHGYLHLQLSRAGNGGLTVLEGALAHAMKLSGDGRLRAVKYLADQSASLEELELLADGITQLGDPVHEANLFSTLAANADKAGHRDAASGWFMAGLDILEKVADPEQRAPARAKLAAGLRRLGDREPADRIFDLALADARGNERIIAKVQRAMGASPAEPRVAAAPDTEAGRHVLGLYDTYEGGLKSVHIRMVARAAPLCIAYNLDLALFGFPEKDLGALVGKVLGDTNIGKGGMYLKELQSHGRIALVQCSGQAPPGKEVWEGMGLPVATTSRPAKGKDISLGDALEKAMAHPKKRLCLIMGLGKKGLPRSLLDSVEHHLELTGRNVALETSTAMGIIARELGCAGREGQ